MQAYFTLSCLLVTSTVFTVQLQQEAACLIAKNENAPLFQRYLAFCRTQNRIDQPVYLRSTSRPKTPSFTDLTIFGLELPLIMQVRDVAERILYGDADVVYLTNVSTQTASHLYEQLEHTYSHFVHVPSYGKGLFIASKYSLSQVEVTLTEQEREKALEFVVKGTTACHLPVSANHVPIQIVNTTHIDTIDKRKFDKL
ncbi:MAG: hypothetical protein HYZ48_03525 [Chlamydiales bacterium]|nr:hypothetical protein [Chlamydiales bacterium]